MKARTVVATAALVVATSSAGFAAGNQDIAVDWAVDNGILVGDGNGDLSLDDPLTRRQAATVLYRYHNRFHSEAAPEDDQTVGKCGWPTDSERIECADGVSQRRR